MPSQRPCPSPDRSCSSPERSADRPMALTTAPNAKAAAAPQIPPVTMPTATSPLHHSTPTLTSTATTKNTTVDNIMVPANLARILHLIVCLRRLCDAPDTHRCRAVTHRYPLCSDVAPVLLLGEGLAQLLLLLLGQVGRDDLEVVLPEFVDYLIYRRRPTGKRKQGGGALSHLLANLSDKVVVDAYIGQ